MNLLCSAFPEITPMTLVLVIKLGWVGEKASPALESRGIW